jgi:hypothetical protein
MCEGMASSAAELTVVLANLAPAGASWRALLSTVKIRQPSHEFTYGVGISFIPYPLVLTPMV